MCLGLGNGYRLNRKLAMISCKKCDRSWQVTEESAKHFNEDYNGICPNCRSREEKKTVSLLKPYTNFDRIKDMTIEKLSEFLDHTPCRNCSYIDVPCKLTDCKDGIKHWLESEVEE